MSTLSFAYLIVKIMRRHWYTRECATPIFIFVLLTKSLYLMLFYKSD